VNEQRSLHYVSITYPEFKEYTVLTYICHHEMQCAPEQESIWH